MDEKFEELCIACRTGDLPNVDRLISSGINLNSVDKFDNSPLFLASLCGHQEVVSLLLRSGAICDRDRHEGARCIYGALTDSIRDLLLSYDISKAVDMNQPFATHISSLLNFNPHLNTFDTTFEIALHPPSNDIASNGISISNGSSQVTRLKAHKFLIHARCPKFFDVICKGQEHQSVIKINNDIPAYILELLLKFIYLVPILHTIKHDDYSFLIKLANELEMDNLAVFLNKAKHTADPSEKSALMLENQYEFTAIAKKQLSEFVDSYIIKNSVSASENSIQEAIHTLTHCQAYPDMIIRVKDGSGNSKIYPCHLAVLLRSDYFKGMFVGPFKEFTEHAKSIVCNGDGSSMLQILDVPTNNIEIFEMTIRYLYYDEFNIPWNYAMEVILLSDFLLISRLKSLAATVITQSKEILEQYSIFDILYFAWSTRLERLEEYVAKHVAIHIKEIHHKKEFKEAILQSSQRISDRQETDTIEFTDDIRFYLLEKYNFEPEDIPFFEEEGENDNFVIESGYLDYKYDMSLITGVLQELELDA